MKVIGPVPDIERNGRNFSDGVGKISEFVARIIADDLELPYQPSAFQFRLGGYKGLFCLVSHETKSILANMTIGVLAVHPELKGSEVVLRESQKKFSSKHTKLEIIRPARHISASLNRQLIHVLTALGVEGHIFERLLSEQMEALKTAMADEDVAQRQLSTKIDEHQMSLKMVKMIRDGFMRTGEPFLATLLQLWRAHSLKCLKEKTKITIEQGSFLLGVVDETGILKGHFEPVPVDEDELPPELTREEKLNSLPEIFCQSDRGDGIFKVHTGVCFIARNPSLHPGDIRVVQAVDVPELHHLKNVLVLPQTGDKDLAGMCSGGDLDGDDYVIVWDQTLIPEIINFEPMDYTAEPDHLLDHDVGVPDMIAFFVNYMKSDRLGQIANTHVVWADKSDEGVISDRCKLTCQP